MLHQNNWIDTNNLNSKIIVISKDQKLHIFDQIPDNHLLLSNEREPFTNNADGKKSIQEYVFSQKFAIVIHNHNKYCSILMFKYTQHLSKMNN